MKDINIVFKNVDDLHPYEKNPRINDEAVQYVKESINQFGFKVPIIIDSNNIIVAGHTRLKAAIELGMEKVPCIIADDLTPKQIKAFRIAENKTNEKSYWDNDLLADELKELEFDIDMTDFGFGEFEIEMLTNDFTPEEYDKDVIEEYAEKAEQNLKSKRVIITYSTDDEEKFLKNILNEKATLKVVYTAKEIMDENI